MFIWCKTLFFEPSSAFEVYEFYSMAKFFISFIRSISMRTRTSPWLFQTRPFFFPMALRNDKSDLFSLMLVPGRHFYCVVIPEWIQFSYGFFLCFLLSLAFYVIILHKAQKLSYKNHWTEKRNAVSICTQTGKELTDTEYKQGTKFYEKL